MSTEFDAPEEYEEPDIDEEDQFPVSGEDDLDYMKSVIDRFDLDPTWVEVPNIDRDRRPHGMKLAEVAWEDVLVNCRNNPNRALQLWTFTHPTAKAMARTRAKVIRARLFAAVPDQEWRVVARSPETGVWAVYAQFNKYLDPSEVAKNQARYKSQVERLELARASKGV